MPLQLANTSSVTPAVEENEALKPTLKVVYKNTSTKSAISATVIAVNLNLSIAAYYIVRVSI